MKKNKFWKVFGIVTLSVLCIGLLFGVVRAKSKVVDDWATEQEQKIKDALNGADNNQITDDETGISGTGTIGGQSAIIRI